MNNNSFSGPIPVNLSSCSNLVTLNIGYNNLTGNIPEEFGSFPKLIWMDLHTNNLNGKIPASLGNLTFLETLYILDNNMDGGIPDSLSQLKRLKQILLASNNLSGMVPLSFYNVSSLEMISFTKNKLQGSLPKKIGINLPNLTRFYIALNHFFGSIPVSLFSNSSNIQKMDLGRNYFTGYVPVEVGNLKLLESLNLGANNLGGDEKVDDLNFLTSMNNCTNLQLLDIDSNNFKGRLPGSISNLSIKLHTFFVGKNQIYGNIPSDIGNLANLITFSVSFNFLSGTILRSIGMLHRLQNLFLTGNRLSGKIPYSIGNITSLNFIDLSDNILEGNIGSFEKCQNLQILYLARNHLTGVVPKQLFGKSSQLIFIRLFHNYLSGSLPMEVGNLKNLEGFDASENKISGEIPSTLGSCSVLESLSLRGNRFHGHIPSSIGYLKGIQDVDLSQNNLSGEIPKVLAGLPYLKILNLSFNNFEGEVPITGIFQNESAILILGNDKLCGGIPKLHLPKCHIRKSKKQRLSLASKVTIGVLLTSLLVSTFTLLVLYSRRKPSVKSSSKQVLANSLLRVSYNELRDATNGFSTESLIGKGSIGSVFKGILRKDESLIAVKVFDLMERTASKSFIAECEVLREIRHRNLLKILTVCSSIDFEGNEFKALVFEFMPNGSLDNWLNPSADRPQWASRNLNFLQRLRIAIDVASALEYLHNYSQPPIVHCDMKASNVLLDDDMVAYVGDFGLAKFLHKKTSNSDKSETNSIGVRGSVGYIPPEYGMGAETSKQGDVYSYGIMLLERDQQMKCLMMA